MKTTVSSTYSVRRGDLVHDRDAILRLWTHSVDTPPDQRKLDWFYVANPAGRSTVFFLDYKPEKRPVGVMCVAPREFLVNGQVRTAAVFGDFVVEPAHRSLGPGLLLQKESVEAALEDFDLQYGFPNPSSSRLRRYAGYSIEQTLRISVIPLDIRYYLARRLPAWLAAIVALPARAIRSLLIARRADGRVAPLFAQAEVDEAFIDGLWSSASQSETSLGVRDWRYVEWRLLNDPFVEHSLFGIRYTDDGPVAYLAFKRGADGHVTVVDFLSTSVEAFQALLALFVKQQDRGGARSLSITTLDADVLRNDVLQSLGFRKRGESEAYLAFGNGRAGVDVGSVYLNLVDNDA